MSDEWDVDSYKSEFEHEDHWQLRRKFMLAHKDKFPEDELVCLAQVFINIEILGCRYPDKTMMRVAELAKGVVEKYRDQRKNSLKRTFVAASDAASAKVKGQVCPEVKTGSTKKFKGNDQAKANLNEAVKVKLTKAECRNVEASNTRVLKYGGVKTFNIKQSIQLQPFKMTGGIQSVSKIDANVSAENSRQPLGNFVLVLGSADEHPVNIIQRNSVLNKCEMRWHFEEVLGVMFVCKLFLNNQCFATSTGSTMKMSKEHTAMVAIAKLRECYYGIRVKSKFFSDTSVSPAQLGICSDKPPEPLGEDNIGRKLMKLMGWTGGGLGIKGQGQVNPITTVLRVKREGLGLNKNSISVADFKKRANDYVKAWMQSNSDQDLVFSSDFNIEERKVLHETATIYRLKSRSYGKDPNRHLVISRKIEPFEILKELLRTGGISDKYELLHPTNT